MRVLQLGPFPPPHGGIQTNLAAIRNFLLARQIPCAVINITGDRKHSADAIYYPKSALGVLALLIRLRYDIIHLHIGGMLKTRLVGLGFVCCSMPRCKAVLTFHSGGYPSSPEGRSAQAHSLTGFFFRRFDAVIAVNGEILEFLRKMKLKPERMKLIPPYSFPKEESREPLTRSLQTFFSAHHPVLLTVGLLEPEYDLCFQIEALGRIREKETKAGLVIIGSGSLEEELRSRIAETSYREHILLCGDVPHPVTMEAISRCDVMLRTTKYDGDAVSVREALHLGTPVIATDNGMRPAGVRLLSATTSEVLSDAIQETLAANSDRPDKHPPDESNLQAILDLYQALLRGTNS